MHSQHTDTVMRRSCIIEVLYTHKDVQSFMNAGPDHLLKYGNRIDLQSERGRTHVDFVKKKNHSRKIMHTAFFDKKTAQEMEAQIPLRRNQGLGVTNVTDFISHKQAL